MPREQIIPRINLRGTEADGGHYVPLPTVQVGWTRDHCNVQIGLSTCALADVDVVHQQPSLVRALYGDSTEDIGTFLHTSLLQLGSHIVATNRGEGRAVTAAELGEMVIAAVEQRGHYTSWWTHLSHRSEVNGLIRLLKKARDVSFGRDE